MFFGDRSALAPPTPAPGGLDLSPFKFFLWSYLKNRVYVKAPATMKELKMKFGVKIVQINAGPCKKVFKNLSKLVPAGIDADGCYFAHCCDCKYIGTSQLTSYIGFCFSSGRWYT